MRPHGAVIARDIADYGALSFAEAVHPFSLQAPAEALQWRITPTVTPTTHALLYPAAPQRLPVLAAGILAALVAVEHHARWPAA